MSSLIYRGFKITRIILLLSFVLIYSCNRNIQFSSNISGVYQNSESNEIIMIQDSFIITNWIPYCLEKIQLSNRIYKVTELNCCSDNINSHIDSIEVRKNGVEVYFEGYARSFSKVKLLAEKNYISSVSLKIIIRPYWFTCQEFTVVNNDHLIIDGKKYGLSYKIPFEIIDLSKIEIPKDKSFPPPGETYFELEFQESSGVLSKYILYGDLTYPVELQVIEMEIFLNAVIQLYINGEMTHFNTETE
ncbi:hypothetical protein ACE1ET_09740 [Saccharicrinis sp. FJH62]|uniref:hypothetical protein n=1 Tax=Saccharicrinis sp. FJH62 TaxID=3344657 RepID=UPI0035D494DD